MRAVLDRVPLLFNADVAISMARPRKEDTFLYRNGQGDEVVFVVEGEGVLESCFGDLPYRTGDYVVIPRGILHRYRVEEFPLRLLVVESRGHVTPPKSYCNDRGQFPSTARTASATFAGRRACRPTTPRESIASLSSSGDVLTEVTLDHHPLRCRRLGRLLLPLGPSIHDFEPITGRLHQPPPVHQTFQGEGYVLCSFVPRLFDYHPQAVPAPYNHSNVMSDEVILLRQRRIHEPQGDRLRLAHAPPRRPAARPAPRQGRRSIGKKETNELAVMLDTFRPLLVSRESLAIEDAAYLTSWLEPQP